MLTVNSRENYLAAGLAGLGIIQIPRIAVREALRAGRLIEVLPGLPCRAALPFADLSAASGAFPACKPVYAVAGWRNERVPTDRLYFFKNDHDRRTKERMTQENEIKRPTRDLEHEPIKQLDNSEKGGKVSQALETVTTTAEKSNANRLLRT